MSCEPTAITGNGAGSVARPGWAAISGRSGPSTLPGWRSGGNSPAGRPARSITPAAQVCARASNSWVVDALVSSAPTSPVSQ